MQRAQAKLMYVVPLTLALIVLLLFIHFRRADEVLMIMATLPFALVGSLWLMFWQGFNFSIPVAVGFIALAGVAIEISVLMLLYLNQALDRKREQAVSEGRALSRADIRSAITAGAGLRVRPIIMTAAAIIIGLLPILYGTGTGSEVMSRIAAPMVGGMLSAVVLTLLVLPSVYLLWRGKGLQN